MNNVRMKRFLWEHERECLKKYGDFDRQEKRFLRETNHEKLGWFSCNSAFHIMYWNKNKNILERIYVECSVECFICNLDPMSRKITESEETISTNQIIEYAAKLIVIVVKSLLLILVSVVGNFATDWLKRVPQLMGMFFEVLFHISEDIYQPAEQLKSDAKKISYCRTNQHLLD